MSIQTQIELLQAVKARNVAAIDLWFVEVPGQLKSLTISKALLEKALQEGISLEGHYSRDRLGAKKSTCW